MLYLLFDVCWYFEKNFDVCECGVNLLLYFVEFGVCEGWNFNSLFDVSWYRYEYFWYEDVGVNLFVYYVLYGLII